MKEHFDRQIIFKALVGSHNYNLATEESDRDYKVFVAPSFEDLYKGNSYSKAIVNHTDGNDYDAHDIRKLITLFSKSNVNFLEVLASEDYTIEEGNPEIETIFKLKKEIFKMNLPYLYNACKGMHFNKMKLLYKGTEGTQHLVDKYGYDTKQALHAYRILRVIEDFAKTGFEDFKGAISYEGKDLELMMLIRHGHMSKERYESFVNQYFNYVFLPLADTYGRQPVNNELREALEQLVMTLIKRKLVA